MPFPPAATPASICPNLFKAPWKAVKTAELAPAGPGPPKTLKNGF